MIKRVTRVARRSLELGLLLLLPAAAPADAQTGPTPARLSAVTVSTQPDSVTVFIKTSGPVKYESDLIEGPDRVVVDLHDTTYAWRRVPLPVTAEPLRQIRGSQYRKDVARIVVELTRKVGYAIREDAEGLSIIIPTRVVAAEQSATPTAGAPRSDAATATAQDPATPEPSTPTPAPGVTAPAIVAPRVAQATQAPAAPAPAPAASQRLISLDFKEADVVNLLRILAAESGRNIVIGDDVKGKMSITLRNVPWELALDTILESRGLERVERDGVMRIVSVEQLRKERAARTQAEEARIKSETDIRAKIAEAELKEQEAQARKLAAEVAAAEAAARGPLREETIRLIYADPEDVARTLQGILGLAGEHTPVSAPPIPGPPPIPAPPFSQLFGPGQPVPPPPPGVMISPTADVLAKGITIRAHRPTNSIFIRHYAADLERLKKLIAEKLDVPLPQVKIEARMEILDRSDLFALGVQWGFGNAANIRRPADATIVSRGFTTSQQPPLGGIGVDGFRANPNLTLEQALPVAGATGLPIVNPSTLIQSGGNVVSLPIGAIGPLIGAATGTGVGGLSFGVIGSRFNVNLALEALRTEGKTRTLARPEVLTVENNKATISLGEEIPYATVSSAGTQIQFKEALLKLEVVPTVVREADHNRIKMKVVVENNSRGVDVVDLGSAGAPPVINRRKAETEVLIKEGERLVIGGVTVSESADAIRKVPLFGDIPVLGWLFKQTAERSASRELVIFITPSVVPRDMPSASLGTGTAQRR